MTWGSLWTVLPVAVLIAALLGARTDADGTVVITHNDLVKFGGFGVFPAPYDRQMPTYADGSPAYGDASWLGPVGPVTSGNIFEALKNSGAEIARVYISPTIGRPGNTLDPARLQDLKDHLASLHNAGIAKYIVTVWSPPAYMKLPDHSRLGKVKGVDQYLDPRYAQAGQYGYADFYVAVLSALKDAGFPAPLAVSLQNEPDVNPDYDGCVYTDTDAEKQTYFQVVKLLRQKLDAKRSVWFRGIPIIGPEESSLTGVESMFGKASASGLAQMRLDPVLANAVGGFAFHSYATAGNIITLNAALKSYLGRAIWMTEYCTATGIRGELRPNSGNQEMDWALNDVRRMAGDIIDIHSNYWFFWRFWHSSSTADEQDLTFGDGQKSKAYYVFQKLWTTVKSGWNVKRCRTTDPDLRTDNSGLITAISGDEWSAPVDILAFEGPAADRSCLMLVNNSKADKRITALSGLRGNAARIFVSTPSLNMSPQPCRPLTSGRLGGGELTLPAYSITYVISSP